MAGGVADPGLGPGVQRGAVAGLPALEVAGRGLQLLGADVGRRAQLELGAALLPVEIGADPPAQQAHRLQGVEAPADRAVMAIAILAPLPPVDPPRRMQRREPCNELAHARHDRPPRPARRRQPPQVAELRVRALERPHVVQPPGRQLAGRDPRCRARASAARARAPARPAPASASAPTGGHGSSLRARRRPRSRAGSTDVVVGAVTATANAHTRRSRRQSPKTGRRPSGIERPPPGRGSVRPGELQFPRDFENGVLGFGRAPVALSGTGSP